MKEQLKKYLSLTKKEWNGITVLVLLITLILAAPYVYQYVSKDNTINPNQLNAALAQLSKTTPDNSSESNNNALKQTPSRFNPNGLPAKNWKELGLNDKQIVTIKNYEAKGGRFYKPTDLKKVYGITNDDYNRLMPFINIPSDAKAIIEINSADSAVLTSVEGIGPVFAKRIIYYRERLGGFIAKEQLKEVFGLDELKYDEIKDRVRVDPVRINKIAINTVTFDKLRLMPYLSYKQVNAIIEYRTQHGNYVSVLDLKNIAIIDDGILRKIEPYLSFK